MDSMLLSTKLTRGQLWFHAFALLSLGTTLETLLKVANTDPSKDHWCVMHRVFRILNLIESEEEERGISSPTCYFAFSLAPLGLALVLLQSDTTCF
eukprot:3553408-Amphidinium_carterae.1